MLLLKLKISSESRSVTSQIENTWTDKKYQILKNSIKIYLSTIRAIFDDLSTQSN